MISKITGKISAGFVAASSLSFLLMACFGAGNVVAAGGGSCETEVAAFDEDIQTLKGKRYKIMDRNLYICRSGKWQFKESLKQASFTQYEITKTADSCTAHNKKTGKSTPLSTEFSSSFEVPDFLSLFENPWKGGWTHPTLKSPKANTVKKYVKLRKAVMAGGDFLENRVDIVSGNVHSGDKAARFYAVYPPAGSSDPSKSLVIKETICFGHGDDLWFSGWFYLEHGVPSTMFDFETRLLKTSPGIRMYIRNDKYASVELKFAGKPQYNQTSRVVPRKKWFNLKLHLKLSNRNDGIIELWQDGDLILSTTGQTLPTYGSIYNAMQVGITATDQETTILVDDIVLSSSPISD